MTPERAKELLPIITAFAEGKAIEVSYPKSRKDVWFPVTYIDWHSGVYRIAPEKKWYRVALTKSIYGEYPEVAISEQEVECLQEDKNFIRWLTDRIEYEV